MTALAFLGVVGLVFAVAWVYFAHNAHPRAKIGPDGTNVREPETFVVHHEGKGQGLDIANTALKERTEHLRRDLPGDGDKVKAPIPGRDIVKMESPPSDVSAYGDLKVAPGAVPGDQERVAAGPVPPGVGRQTKEQVLTEGPLGSRPGSPEEPGSAYGKGRRVTDNHRDVETSAELLANAYPNSGRQVGREMAATPSTTGQEPGYGLGRTTPGGTDGEGGTGPQTRANEFPHETASPTGQVVAFPGRGRRPAAPLRGSGKHRANAGPNPPPEEPDSEGEPDEFSEDLDLTKPAPDPEMRENATYTPDRRWTHEIAEEFQETAMFTSANAPDLPEDLDPSALLAAQEEQVDWSALWEELPLPIGYYADVTVALIRNPESAYVYWDRGGTAEAALRQVLGDEVYDETVPVLRVWVDGARGWDIRVGETDDHWFVNGLQPGRTYAFSYERMSPEGLYYQLSQSDPLTMPHDQPTPETPALLYHYHGYYSGRPYNDVPNEHTGTSTWR